MSLAVKLLGPPDVCLVVMDVQDVVEPMRDNEPGGTVLLAC